MEVAGKIEPLHFGASKVGLSLCPKSILFRSCLSSGNGERSSRFRPFSSVGGAGVSFRDLSVALAVFSITFLSVLDGGGASFDRNTIRWSGMVGASSAPFGLGAGGVDMCDRRPSLPGAEAGGQARGNSKGRSTTKTMLEKLEKRETEGKGSGVAVGDGGAGAVTVGPCCPAWEVFGRSGVRGSAVGQLPCFH